MPHRIVAKTVLLHKTAIYVAVVSLLCQLTTTAYALFQDEAIEFRLEKPIGFDHIFRVRGQKITEAVSLERDRVYCQTPDGTLLSIRQLPAGDPERPRRIAKLYRHDTKRMRTSECGEIDVEGRFACFEACSFGSQIALCTETASEVVPYWRSDQMYEVSVYTLNRNVYEKRALNLQNAACGIEETVLDGPIGICCLDDRHLIAYAPWGPPSVTNLENFISNDVVGRMLSGQRLLVDDERTVFAIVSDSRYQDLLSLDVWDAKNFELLASIDTPKDELDAQEDYTKIVGLFLSRDELLTIHGSSVVLWDLKSKSSIKSSLSIPSSGYSPYSVKLLSRDDRRVQVVCFDETYGSAIETSVVVALPANFGKTVFAHDSTWSSLPITNIKDLFDDDLEEDFWRSFSSPSTAPYIALATLVLSLFSLLLVTARQQFQPANRRPKLE